MKLKNIKYTFIIPLLAVLAISCSESDKVFDQITDDVTRGAILRQLNTISNSVAINSATNELEAGEEYSVVLEYQDIEDGALLSQLLVYVGFQDNTDDDVDNSKAEVLAETIPASSFSPGDRGLPQLNYAISAQDMQSAVGLNSDQIGFGGDRFTVRFQIELTDGRTFTDANNSGTITGSYYSSPFLNNVNVVCAPSVPTAGTWSVETTDLWGDGWNGGALNIVIDGQDAGSIENVDGGIPGPVSTTQSYNFEVPAGTQTISIMYVPGAFDEEVLFVITSANGNVVSSLGPNPVTNTELLDYCLDNL